MNLYDLFIIAMALALDAFGVALSIGFNPSVKLFNKILFCISFGFFQFVFAFFGSFMGVVFITYIASIPKIVGGIIIAITGIMMIREGLKNEQECVLFSKKMYIVLGVSVSIDAMVVGFTVFNRLSNIVDIGLYSAFIGIIALIMTAVAFVISKYLKKIWVFAEYADFIGGLILIIFGIKLIFY